MRITELNPRTRRIQGGLKEGLYLSARFSYVGFGPPHIDAFGLTAFTGDVNADDTGATALVWPCGMIQSVGLSQNSNQPRLFEVGTDRHYTLRGRTLGQIGISAIEYDGPTLLRRAYAAFSDGVNIGSLFPNRYYQDFGTASNEDGINDAPIEVTPGYENGWINMASDVFERPFGTLLVMKTSDQRTHTAVYAESCYIPSHNLRFDASGTIITSGVSIQYERIIPVRVSPVRELTSMMS